ncbi:MAG TPA: hypothetical protein VF493_00200 [Terriglobales bacterium]
MRQRYISPVLLFVLLIAAIPVHAGGPLVVGGPKFGTDGQPFTWNPAKMPIQYRLDPGPMAVSPANATVIDNASGLQRAQNMFAVWQSVPTTAISFSNAGPLLSAGSYASGTDLNTVQQFNDMVGSCRSAAQNPVIFDANGQLMSGLGLPAEVIGFASGCALDPTTGYLTGALIVMNGKFQDGVDTPQSSPPNYELTANEFDEAITHEIGHFSGLDHSQINVDLLTNHTFPCDVDRLAGLPLMFPEEICQARKDAGLPVLSSDDMSWISSLYPNANFDNNYGTISGTIYFSDGVSQFQGVNVIARAIDDPATPQDESRRIAISATSGYLFTGNPGQSFTADMPDPSENNTNGNTSGSRNPKLIGYYQIAVPPGTYTVEVEAINPAFVGGSSVGRLSPPVALPFTGLSGPVEFWNKDESAFDCPLQRDTITIHSGEKITGIDIILNNTQSTFDQYEDSGALFDPPIGSPLGIGTAVLG